MSPFSSWRFVGVGEPLKGLQVPPEVVSQIVTKLRDDQRQAAGKVSADRTRLDARLTGIRNRMDAAYTDKLDGKISEEFWERKMHDWQMEEQQVKMAIQGLRSEEHTSELQSLRHLVC